MNVRDLLSKATKSQLAYYFFVIVYRMLIDIIYSNIIIVHYGSVYGYVSKQTIEFAIISWIILILFMICTKKYYYRNTGVSNSVVFLLFLMSIVPYTTLIRFGQFSYSYILANTIYWGMFYLAIYFWGQISTIWNQQKYVIHSEKSSSQKILMFTLIEVILVLFLCGRYSGFRLSLSLENVYVYRAEATLYGVPTVLRYLYNWSTWVNPFLIAYYIRNKNYKFAIMLSFLQILMFGYDGMKAPFLFATLIILINIFLPKITISSLNSLTLYGVCALCLLSLVTYELWGNYALANTFINRLNILTNVISYAYYLFFTTNTPDYFRSSFLRYFGIKSPYSNITHMISIWYFGFDQGANDGLIADAVCNFGLVGIVIMPFVIGGMLKIFDSYSNRLDERIALPAAIYLFIMLTSMFFLPILLTGGLLVIMFLLNQITKSKYK